MRRVAVSSRWAAWVFAFALLLKAAVPMLAATAADARGKALAEICTVYGVATVPLDADAGTDARHGPGDPCALAAVVAGGAAPAPAAFALATGEGAAAPHPPAPTAARPDREGAWRARLGHGPPAGA